MKYLSLAILLNSANLLFGCQSPNNGKTGTTIIDSTYTLTGKIAGFGNGNAYIIHEESPAKTRDSVRITNGAFVITGKAPIPEFCVLDIIGDDGRESGHVLFLQNGQITLTGQKDFLERTLITGAPLQDEYNRYLVLNKPFDSLSGVLNQAYEKFAAKKNKAGVDSIENVYAELEKERQQFVRNYAHEHPTSYVAAYKVYETFSYNADDKLLDSIYNGLDSILQYSYFGKEIRSVIGSSRRTAIGNPAPDFSQPDTKGVPVALSSLKGHYVLVDFWASWCGPCRRENPNVVNAWKKYRSKGFTVLGVSLDEKKDNWIEAIRKDRLDWAQVSDLKGWQSSAAALYGVKAIPMNFLLDKDGKIIGKGLQGEALNKKLAEVLP